ncbi:MAG: NHL repeat-containing protein, partial [Gammaproteobacteria bacterium]|nr:NHL repeat-containing protein [Gammaproteobacteria bacterium]
MNESMQGLIRQAIVAILLLVVLAWVPFAEADPADRSDLNNDNTVDFLDLEIFSNKYLAQDWETVDWCRFYESSISNEKYFRKYTSDKTERYDRLLKFIASSYDCKVTSSSVDKSDLNKDLNIDVSDLSIFSTNYLETYWETVDWCLFHDSTLAGSEFEGRSTKYFLQHFGLLLSFINDYFDCGGSEPPPNALQLENAPKYLARIADAGYFTGDYYITDPNVSSLFIYDADLVLKAEIKGLNRPLGVAIDSQGYILIGSDGRDNIEVYDPANGDLLAVFGEGLVKMPTAITVDTLGSIYVTDSRSNNIRVFDPAYNPVRIIGKAGEGEGELNFPVDTEIIIRSAGGVANMQEIFVADQGNKRVQVYDLEG